MAKIDRTESVRKERVPVGSSRAPLRYKGFDTENYYQRWVMDDGNRIQMFLEAGYEFFKPTKSDNTFAGEKTVESSKGIDGRLSRAAGRGDPRRLYAMELPIKFYTEDQKAKQKEVDATEETMHVAKGKTRKGGEESDAPDYGKISLVRKDVKKGGIPKDDE